MTSLPFSFAQLIADLALIVLSGLTYLKVPRDESLKFFKLIFISLIFAALSNEIYNWVTSFQLPITFLMDTVGLLSYLIFLGVQIAAYAYLLSVKRNNEPPHAKSWVALSSEIQILVVGLLLSACILIFKKDFLDNLFTLQRLNTLLEVFLVAALLSSLIATKNKAITLLSTGFLLAFAFNLAHRFADTPGHYYPIVSALWFICPLILIAGFITALKNPAEKLSFFAENSIHALVSIFIIFASFLTVLIVIAGFLIATSGMQGLKTLGLFPENIVSVAILSLSFSVLLSKFSTNYFLNYLTRLNDHVHRIQSGTSHLKELTQHPSPIYEIAVLEDFILNTVDELHKANRVKANFLRNMSHDFRTPASGIYQMSTSIYKRMLEEDELKPKQKRIVDSSEQLMNFLDEILFYSNLENGKEPLEIKELDIVALINEVIAFVLPKIEENGLSIKTNFSKESLQYVGYRNLLYRILLNLVSNAIKFTPEGLIEIRVREITKDSQTFVQIAIKDTGIGIAREEQEKIFEPFYRIKTNDSSPQSGIGLGLSSVRLMLQEMQGEISLESFWDKGSTFIIQLPLNRIKPTTERPLVSLRKADQQLSSKTIT